MALTWTSVWVHVITIRVDVVVIIWFQFVHVCACVLACLDNVVVDWW